MIDVETACILIEACKQHVIAADGDSGDDEHDSAVELRRKVMTLVRNCSLQDESIRDLIKNYEVTCPGLR